MNNQLTMCAIMQNEEHCLPTFLENVKGLFDDYVFVDGGSTDNSAHLVEQAGYKVHQIQFKLDFAAQKNNALKLAKTKWRMFLDIDEKMSRGIQAFMQMFIPDNYPPTTLVAFFRDNYLDGNNQDDFPLSFVIRLFNDEVRYQGNVHEVIDPTGKTIVRYFGGRIYHCKDSYRQYRANLIYELIRRGVTEPPPADQGAFNQDGRLRKVRLLPGREIEVLDEYIEGPLLNVGIPTAFG